MFYKSVKEKYLKNGSCSKKALKGPRGLKFSRSSLSHPFQLLFHSGRPKSNGGLKKTRNLIRKLKYIVKKIPGLVHFTFSFKVTFITLVFRCAKSFYLAHSTAINFTLCTGCISEFESQEYLCLEIRIKVYNIFSNNICFSLALSGFHRLWGTRI